MYESTSIPLHFFPKFLCPGDGLAFSILSCLRDILDSSSISSPSKYTMPSFSAKSIVPLLNRVLVRKVKPLEKTAAGILIPEKAQERLNRGEVLAVGPGSEDYKMQLRVGDRVVLPAYGGQEIKFEVEGSGSGAGEGDQVLLYKEEEILAKINE
jgi:chaperonin GroES